MELWKQLWVEDEKWMSHQEGKLEGKLQEKIHVVKKIYEKIAPAEIADIVELPEEMVRYVITLLTEHPNIDMQELVNIISSQNEELLLSV